MKHPAVTVVIATLGGPSLAKTISFIRRGSLQPEKILVCIPRAERFRVSWLAGYGIKIVTTQKRGQVIQRVAGFRQVRTPLVLQMDDDVFLHPRCLEFLVTLLKKTDEVTACGPFWRWRESRLPCHRISSDQAGFISRRFSWHRLIKNIPGCITLLGTNNFVVNARGNRKPLESEWLPGGCVLHRRKNLFLKNYYPFPGKAFSEDVMHSIYLRKKGIRLLVEPKAVAYINQEAIVGNIILRVSEILKQSAARRHVLKLLRRSKLPELLYTTLALITLPFCCRTNSTAGKAIPVMV